MAEHLHPTALSQLLANAGHQLPAAEWERLISEAQRAGDLDEAEVSALHGVHDRLVEAGRREGLLRLLHDTSTDLIGIRDVEASLKAIVRRTRSLLNTDISYLSLNDYERGESYVRVTDGATTAAFRTIRIPLGGGVLGTVATGAAPAQSADYPRDTTKSHFPDSDSAVIGEGVKAIMGVPLWAGGTVIGALMVADRRAHEFDSDDISVLESIGAHAAVALDNARLFTDMSQTLDQLHAAQRENTDHVRSLEALTALDQQLMETLAAEDILPSLRRLIATTLDTRVWILDPSGEPIGDPPTDEGCRDARMREAAARSRSHRIPVPFSVGDTPFMVMSAVAANEHMADLLVADVNDDRAAVIIERSTLVLSTAMLFERTLREAQFRLQRELVDELLSPRTQITEALRRRAQRFGVGDDAMLVVRAVCTLPEDRARAVTLLRRFARPSQVVAAYADVVCVVEGVTEDSDDSGQWVVDLLSQESILATVGSSTSTCGLRHLPAAFDEARTVQSALIALDRRGEAAGMPQLGTAGMLLGGVDRAFARRLLHSHLGALIDYDRRRRTELMQTAWVYLDAGGGQKAAADRLHIHPNTLRQRLDRIDDLLGDDWRVGGRALDIHIALQLWRLQEHRVTD